MWKMRILAALTPALLLGLAGCNSPPPTPVLFGHIASVHDSNGAAQRGIRLAVELHNKDGAGRPVKVLHAKAHGKLEVLEAEAVRLVSVNRVQALLGGNTAAELERLDRTRAVIVSPCGLRPAALSDQVFCTGLGPAFVGQVLARFARDELKIKKAAIVADERCEEYRLTADAFARTWTAGKDAPAVTRLSFGKEAKFADLAKRLEEAAPDVVLFAGRVEDLRAWRQAQSLAQKKTVILFGGDEGSLAALMREKETRNGVYLATAFVAAGGTPRMKKFAAQYRELFQEEPDVHAALAYDNARLLFEAERRAEEKNYQTLREELAALKDFASLSGPLGFDAEQCAHRPAFVVKLESGKAETVKRYSPPG